jgi:ATP-binding cassette, subfamily B, bacterial
MSTPRSSSFSTSTDAVTSNGKAGRVRFDDDSISRQRVRPGTVRRILPYARRRRAEFALLMLVTVLHAIITAASPLLLKVIIDDGITAHRPGVVLTLCGVGLALALVDTVALYIQVRCSVRVGEGLVYDLRTAVFAHVQRQPIAFFLRARTGSLVSRLNTDVAGARQALTALLTQSVSTVLTLTLVLTAMFYLSWQIAAAALVMVPFFLLPARLSSRRQQRLAREGMQLDADISALMSERFNVAGAMLAKLYGRAESESALFAGKAARIRDVVAARVVQTRILVAVLAVLTALTTALVYGLGGALAISGALPFGTLVAVAVLLMRVYGPINQLSTMQTAVQTALVSFDRLFEILDLEPLVAERPGARMLPCGTTRSVAPDLVFEGVGFQYPSADMVSIASLEAAGHRSEGDSDSWVLRDLTFTARAGQLTALVGPSGAGKTTVSQLVPRLYDPSEGSVRIGGHDLRDLTLRSVRDTVGVVPQDAYLFHDTLRANLEFARPGATEDELITACRDALIWDTVRALPNGLDTKVGDLGFRMSGGEKQRISLARLLLKAPAVVVLDEATAHLDATSEAAVQQALRTALAGRTSLVIAHRLSTIREADRILVMDGGRLCESGTHDELLAAGGRYAALYHTQFSPGGPIRDAGDLPGVHSCQNSN